MGDEGVAGADHGGVSVQVHAGNGGGGADGVGVACVVVHVQVDPGGASAGPHTADVWQ